jgi:antitoxin (DNA-binding transcriptional repressor) of toxin-antitoxin stability system
MSITLPIERAEQNLRGLIAHLDLGETVTLIGTEGVPIALLVSLKPLLRESQEEADWDTRWDALARQVSQAWKNEKSAVELLTEMRR